MRGLLTASLVAAAIGLGSAPLSAAPTSTPVVQNATPLTQLAQYGGYRRSCRYGYHYACWYDYYGYRHCGCQPNY
jgi:hypothetical protein